MIDILFSIPKTLYFCFCYLPIKQAVKLPIWIHFRTKVKCPKNNHISLKISSSIRFAMIRVGFHLVPAKDPNVGSSICIESGGRLEFKGEAHIGRGSRIFVARGGNLILGDNFAISASSTILCYKKMIFGNDIQFSWDCLVMDSDTHSIYDEEGNRFNEDKQIIVGNKVWIGCGVTVLKGSVIPNNCVIGAKSVVSTNNFLSDSIIVGNPAKSIKKIGKWEL